MITWNRSLKRLVFVLLSLAVLLAGFMWFINRATTAQISVETNRKGSSVAIVSLSDYKSNGIKKFGGEETQKLVVNTKPGDYVVVARADSSYSTKYIKVIARQDQDIKLRLNTALNPEPVIGQDSLGLSATDSSLYFIKASNGLLSRIDSQNTVAEDPSHVFKKSRWTTDGLGLALSEDGGLYVIENGVVRPVPLPFKANGNPSVNFDITSSGKVYITNGQTVFAGDLNGNFSVIYSAGSGLISAISASDSAAAFIEKTASGKGNLIKAGDGQPTKIASGAIHLSWSPDGKHLVTSEPGQLGVLYDSSLSQAARLPNFEPDNFVWSDASSLIYSASGFMWEYSLSDKSSKVLTYYASGQNVTASNINVTTKQLYFSSLGDENGQISRINIKGPPISRSLKLLGTLLPETVGVCSLDYVAYGPQPSITVSYTPNDTLAKNCIEAARVEIGGFGLNPNDFQYVAIPTGI